jgi:hypothetical protein
VLDRLDNLDIVSVDKSISMKTGEVLRPDVVAYHVETRTIVVFEVKREKGTERQAVSELAGYEHELQNLFPFMSNMDVCFVVVARNWSELLRHGVAGMVTWSGKQCLALSLDFDAEPRELKCQVVEAWHPTGTVEIPQRALQCFDVALYERSAPGLDPGDGGNEEDESADAHVPVPRLVETAAQMISRDGDRMRSHGFLVVWEDTAGANGVRWVITVCVFDHAVFHATARDNVAPRLSGLAKYFSAIDGLASGAMPTSGFRILDQSKKILEEDYNVTLEGFSTWSEKMREHRHRAAPVMFEFWGLAGEFARSFVASPNVRNALAPFLSMNAMDWRHPVAANLVIGYMCGRLPFQSGEVLCRDAFEAGVTLGALRHTYAFLDEAQSPGESSSKEAARRSAEALSMWQLPEAVLLMTEAAQLYRSYADITQPPPALTEQPGHAVGRINAIIAWINDSLINGERPHCEAFELGTWYGHLYEAVSAGVAVDESADGVLLLRARGDAFVCGVVTRMIDVVAGNDGWPGVVAEARSYLDAVEAVIGHELGTSDLRRKSVAAMPLKVFLPVLRLAAHVLDHVVSAVYHELLPMPPINVDMVALRHGARAVFDGGDRRPAVIVDPSGNYGVGRLPPEGRYLPPIDDIDDGVYFFDNKSGHGMMVRMTWVQIEAALGGGSHTA